MCDSSTSKQTKLQQVWFQLVFRCYHMAPTFCLWASFFANKRCPMSNKLHQSTEIYPLIHATSFLFKWFPKWSKHFFFSSNSGWTKRNFVKFLCLPGRSVAAFHFFVQYTKSVVNVINLLRVVRVYDIKH